MDSHYEVLGVDSDATPKRIRAAYREKAKIYHPDVNDSPNAQKQFIRIKRAKDVLLNPKARRRYDRRHDWDSYTRSERRQKNKRKSNAKNQNESQDHTDDRGSSGRKAEEQRRSDSSGSETVPSWGKRVAWRFGDAILYARNEERWISTTLVGGSLIILTSYIVPAIAVMGYLARVFRYAADKEENLPPFSHWGANIVNGFRLSLILLAYVGALVVAGGLSASVISPSIAAIIILPGTIAIIYAIPAALAVVVETGVVKSGFDFDRLRSIIFQTAYMTGWATAVALVAVSAILVVLAERIPEPWRQIDAFIQMYFLVAASQALGHAWSEIEGIGE